MADIHVLPVAADENVDHATALLANAFAEGVDLGPRGHHIKAIALTLEQQVEHLRQVIDEFRGNPIRTMIGLDELEDQLSRLRENIAKLAAMAQSAGR